MKVLATFDNIEYGVPEVSDLGAMAAVLSKSFAAGEPMAVAIGFPAAAIDGIVRLFDRTVLAEELTIVARPPEGAIVGALFSGDLGTPAPDGFEEFPDFAPIGALIEGLDHQYTNGRRIAPGEIAHLFMLGISASASGRGIAQRLVEVAVSNAQAKGYRTAITEATGPVSQHIFRKLGFVERFRTDYVTFEIEGRRPFASLAGGTALMERRLN